MTPSGPARTERALLPGATPGADGTTFTLWSGGARAVELCLVAEDGTEERVGMPEPLHGTWSVHVPGVGAGQRYGYRVHGPWDPWRGARFNRHKLLLDPCAKAVTGPLVPGPQARGHAGDDDTVADDRDSAAVVPLAVVVDDAFDWGDDRPPATPWSRTVVYEAHVRGLTKTHPDVPEQLRGTYAGLAHPAVVAHLRDLGVTAVELLPVHAFLSEPRLDALGLSNHWGYSTLSFFAPHGAYSSSGSTGGQVREFKEMVRALHAAGLEVLLDVVYNHTAEGGEDGPTLSLRGIDNAAYYRTRAGRRYTDDTGCGNTLDTSRAPGLRLVADSLRYWVREMHVDGFRFDLAVSLARDEDNRTDLRSALLQVIDQDPVLRGVKLIAEPWDLGPDGYQVGGFPAPWAEWNDRYRDAVRSFWAGQAHGVRELANRLAGSSDLFEHDGRRPWASVDFVTAHDGFTLRDLVSHERKHNRANGEDDRDGSDENRAWNCGVEGETDDPQVQRLRRRQLRNLLTTLLVSTGTPMLLAGDELGRTQGGNNNAYCQDNEVSWVDWALQPWQEDLRAFTAGLLDLRRRHPVLRQGHFFTGRPVETDRGGAADLTWFGPDGRPLGPDRWHDADLATLGVQLSGNPLRDRGAAGERLVDDDVLVLLHGGRTPTEVVLPGSSGTAYEVLVDTADEAAPLPREGARRHRADERLRLDPLSALVLRALP